MSLPHSSSDLEQEGTYALSAEGACPYTSMGGEGYVASQLFALAKVYGISFRRGYTAQAMLEARLYFVMH